MKYFNPHGPAPMRKPKAHAKPTVTGVWSPDEHKRFLIALEQFPHGPWKAIALHVGTRTARQTQTHAQKYRQKLIRKVPCPDEAKKVMFSLVQRDLSDTLADSSAASSPQQPPVAVKSEDDDNDDIFSAVGELNDALTLLPSLDTATGRV
ncbi:hypothetical protein SPRG_13445 [Saprolegnia parasitica CBS 223.65]|uniref:Uncharacterized protein n=1 Tax=Saprolegnia parasitica (strain CBS 223.65) TaxID=695850 RepID=A0A067BTR8_SAPPC|nr:hypothetical protein SPRG_13445 [Saprolegnia parasitica CBS 223.65]KDO20190.1 hypothetical protein SPRG_13445 [Saprolegnia parasitica CBS 223.65]|eukprot:XP_012209078.1 hypothetical protein SPRG_13445 [Saprolegnia parasitica CBS 223.65]